MDSTGSWVGLRVQNTNFPVGAVQIADANKPGVWHNMENPWVRAWERLSSD